MSHKESWGSFNLKNKEFIMSVIHLKTNSNGNGVFRGFFLCYCGICLTIEDIFKENEA